VKTISLAALHAAITTRTVTVFEALPEKYFLAGRLPDAHHAPADLVVARARALGLAPSSPIVVYCASATCTNSHAAAAALASDGFTDVAVFVGGKQAWTDAGLPLTGAEPAEPAERQRSDRR
jgi:rhodanese-related sulfurtransferase